MSRWELLSLTFIRGWFCIYYIFNLSNQFICDIHHVKVDAKHLGRPCWLARAFVLIWSLFVTCQGFCVLFSFLLRKLITICTFAYKSQSLNICVKTKRNKRRFASTVSVVFHQMALAFIPAAILHLAPLSRHFMTM